MKNQITNIEKLQTKVAETILIASGILIFLIILDDLTIELYWIAILKIPMIFIFILAYIKLKISGFQEKYSHFVNLPILVFFILNYLGNQGSDGPTFYGVLTLFVTYPILLSPKWKRFYTVLTIILMSFLLYFGSDKQNLIVPHYINPMDQFQDHLFTFISVSAFLVILLTLVLDFYKKQNLELTEVQWKLKEQLEFANAEKLKNEILLRVLAHDVRSPVNNLDQLIDLYEAEDLTKLEFKQLASGMKSRILDLKNTIDNILINLKKDYDEEVSRSTVESPIEFTKSLVDRLKYIFETKRQQIIFVSETGMDSHIQFERNVSEITIILKNLLDNASKYSSEGSEIRVSLQISAAEIDWTVESQGEPIPEELQKKLFAETVISQNGSGVGLFLCKSIADRMGARLTYTTKQKVNCFSLKIG